MNKLFKGAVAGAAGVALLLGGAGTFALWNDAVTIGAAGQRIDAGHLRIMAVDGATWTVNGGEPVDDITNVALVPGDVIRYSADVDILAHGDNLLATFTITNPTGTQGNDGQTGTEDVHGDPVTETDAGDSFFAALQPMTWTITPEGGTPVDGNTINIQGMPGVTDPGNAAEHTMTYGIALEMTFNPNTSGTLAQGGQVNLDGFRLAVQQTTGPNQATPTPTP